MAASSLTLSDPYPTVSIHGIFAAECMAPSVTDTRRAGLLASGELLVIVTTGKNDLKSR